jgi:transposase
MITQKQIELVDKAVEKGFRDQDSSNAWRQIKSYLSTIVQQSLPDSANATSKSCPYCKSKTKSFRKMMIYRCENDNCGWSGHDFG